MNSGRGTFDMLFGSRRALQELMPKLLNYSPLCFGAEQVIPALGLIGRM